ALLIRDAGRSLREGALAAWPDLTENTSFLRFAEALARHAGFSLDTPFEQLDPVQQRAVLHGTGEAWIALESGARSAEREEGAAAREGAGAGPRPSPPPPPFFH